ncbi:hypothetical protein [Bacillus sp. SM2101]|uniref:hypothetical protein n=1 Tax=Bacillus sp. SM2101 TaxID=2805366 RepID=UPI001BDE9A43|nr:hypothetical protein [Bacillus sp. SM2101]
MKKLLLTFTAIAVIIVTASAGIGSEEVASNNLEKKSKITFKSSVIDPDGN